ncbi:MAG: DinB family protein [Gemmatimonadetes bacterium]|nr:DinB family protein [Gemmatimonadota bacterium]
MHPLTHPRLREVAGYLDSVRGRLSALVAGTPRARFTAPATDGRWNGAQIVPYLRFGPLNAYEWLLLIGKHEERHLGQFDRQLAVSP